MKLPKAGRSCTDDARRRVCPWELYGIPRVGGAWRNSGDLQAGGIITVQMGAGGAGKMPAVGGVGGSIALIRWPCGTGLR